MRYAMCRLVCLLAGISAASAQTAEQVRSQLIGVCMQASGAGEARCVCFTDTVLGNLAPGEALSLYHGQDTPHTLQVGLLARRQCGVRFPGD